MYRKTKETDLCWSATAETGVLCIGRGVAYRKTGLHGLLFIHRRPPPASTCDCSSTGSCSSSLHRALLHRLLFNQPSPRGSCSTTPPRATIHPALHRLLFILPSTGWSCSSCPPRGPVHPAPTGSINLGPVHPEATPRGLVHPPPPRTVHPNPPATLTVHPEAASIGFS